MACSEATKEKFGIVVWLSIIFCFGIAVGHYGFACTDLQSVQQSNVDLESNLHKCQVDLEALRDQHDWHEKMSNQYQDESSRCKSDLQEENDNHGSCHRELVSATTENKYAKEKQEKLEIEMKECKDDLKKQRVQYEEEKKKKEEKSDTKLKEYVKNATECELGYLNVTRSLEFCEESKEAEVSKSTTCADDLSECIGARRRVEESIHNLTNTKNMLEYDNKMSKKLEKSTRTWISLIGVGTVLSTFLLTCLFFFLGITYCVHIGRLSYNSDDPSGEFLRSQSLSRDLKSDQSKDSEKNSEPPQDRHWSIIQQQHTDIHTEQKNVSSTQEFKPILVQDSSMRVLSSRSQHEQHLLGEEMDIATRNAKTSPHLPSQVLTSTGVVKESFVIHHNVPSLDEIRHQSSVQNLEQERRKNSLDADISDTFIRQPHEIDRSINLFTAKPKVDIVPQKRKNSMEDNKEDTTEIHKLNEPKRVKHQHGDKDKDFGGEFEDDEFDEMDQENDGDEMKKEEADVNEKQCVKEEITPQAMIS